MRIWAITLLAFLLATALAGCAAVDEAITKDMRAKDPTACEDGRVWRRAASAPDDCLEDDAREACQQKCRASGE